MYQMYPKNANNGWIYLQPFQEEKMSTRETYGDPFWSSFAGALKMVQFFNILPKDECRYWSEFITDQEYPTEEELDTFVNICKNGMKTLTKTNDCTFVGFVDSIENIEGFWPYA